MVLEPGTFFTYFVNFVIIYNYAFNLSDLLIFIRHEKNEYSYYYGHAG